jgi:hypothetical protein
MDYASKWTQNKSAAKVIVNYNILKANKIKIKLIKSPLKFIKCIIFHKLDIFNTFIQESITYIKNWKKDLFYFGFFS